ncbi:MAG: hypothetical protein ACRD44_05165, partial [Bryobacteraceae bacterium]
MHRVYRRTNSRTFSWSSFSWSSFFEQPVSGSPLSDVGNISSPQFSPDGKWISYSKPGAFVRPRVYVKNLATGEERRIGSDDFLTSTGAKWTP